MFGRNMTINSLIQVNWQAIKNKREARAEKDNDRENKNRKFHKYKEGNLCLILAGGQRGNRKLQRKAEGPYKIIKVYKNGNVKIERGGYHENINIRRLKPCYDKSNDVNTLL